MDSTGRFAAASERCSSVSSQGVAFKTPTKIGNSLGIARYTPVRIAQVLLLDHIAFPFLDCLLISDTMSKTPEPRLLIDGYNVLFHGGLEGTDRRPGWMDAARARLIELLERKLTGEECRRTQVVFDAAEIRARTRDDFVSAKGIRVVFALSHFEADDLIEEIVARHSHPKQLEVVSSDNRLRTKASRRRATSTSSEDFLDFLEEMPDVVDEPHKAAEHAAGQPLNNVARELRNVKAELGNDIANSKELEEFLREFGPDNEQA